ncbi:hypothetical protein CEUSTIGMA_g13764.t1 [Chlamydomonas eustigma]|uniref:No apical meristem-associated C-terminal domain-containing protein n=1 Tax=Chlamydomonas eustigma TaxID=1157962 RepID=A0A250XTU5_9CHLO|nr:hypothetical protein CEUSTIGMA_g13764.t1 [Chlamydomonas eustigma]|eukprot:GAX86352.1 hypothetical protein CEUSTIGMA_g13764.t1 [Chlamydomonas eustigma]
MDGTVLTSSSAGFELYKDIVKKTQASLKEIDEKRGRGILMNYAESCTIDSKSGKKRSDITHIPNAVDEGILRDCVRVCEEALKRTGGNSEMSSSSGADVGKGAAARKLSQYDRKINLEAKAAKKAKVDSKKEDMKILKDALEERSLGQAAAEQAAQQRRHEELMEAEKKRHEDIMAMRNYGLLGVMKTMVDVLLKSPTGPNGGTSNNELHAP